MACRSATTVSPRNARAGRHRGLRTKARASRMPGGGARQWAHRVSSPRTRDPTALRAMRGCSTCERRHRLLGRFQAGGSMTQPRHRVRLGAHILPTPQDLLELTALSSPTQHENLTASILKWAEPCHVELAGLSYPCGAVDGPMGSDAPPQPDVLLARGSPAAIRPIEVTQRPVSVGSVGERPA